MSSLPPMPPDLEPEETAMWQQLHGGGASAVRCPTLPQLRAYAAAESESPEVELHVRACRACQTILADLAALEAAPPTPAERQRLDARVLAATRGEAMPRSVPAGPRSSWLPLALAAAALIFALGAGIFVWRLETTRLSPRQASAPSLAATPVFHLDKPPVNLPAALIWRGAPNREPAWQEPLRRALIPYRANDFAAAAAALAPLVRQYPNQPEPAFYLGVSQLFLGQNGAAAATLAQAAGRASGQLADSAQWYRSLALIRAGQPAQARAPLAALCQAGGLYATRACVGLQALANSR